MNCYDLFGNRDAMMPYGIDLNAAQLGTGCETTDKVNPVSAVDLGDQVKLQW